MRLPVAGSATGGWCVWLRLALGGLLDGGCGVNRLGGWVVRGRCEWNFSLNVSP